MCVDYSRLPEWYVYIYIHECINYLHMHWPTCVVVFSACGLCSYANSYIPICTGHYAPLHW